MQHRTAFFSNDKPAASLTPKKDKVTISLYGIEQDDNKSFKAALGQISNIKNIKEKLSAAAKKAARLPPEVVISILIIPDWEHGSFYENGQYRQIKEQYFYELKQILAVDDVLKDIEVEDFYNKDSIKPEEKAYLQNLEAQGSNADMIKTHAIICDGNSDRRHLQMDSNTKIFDFDELYRETFGRENQKDALNASFYDESYVSAHNKIVYTTYTTPGGRIAPALKEMHLAYCNDHKDDHKNDKTKVEKKEKNSIYSKNFVLALAKLGLTTKNTIHPKPDTPKIIYTAEMSQPEYRLTRCVLTAVRMSWRSNHMAELSKLPAIRIGDAECDYECFRNVVKKYTGSLIGHIPEIDNNSDDEEKKDALEEKAHKALMDISNQHLEKTMVKQFIENVAKNCSKPLLEAIVREIPTSTPRGGDFFKSLFGYSVEDYLRYEPWRAKAKTISPG